jgi:hypothetical protein
MSVFMSMTMSMSIFMFQYMYSKCWLLVPVFEHVYVHVHEYVHEIILKWLQEMTLYRHCDRSPMTISYDWQKERFTLIKLRTIVPALSVWLHIIPLVAENRYWPRVIRPVYQYWWWPTRLTSSTGSLRNRTGSGTARSCSTPANMFSTQLQYIHLPAGTPHSYIPQQVHLPAGIPHTVATNIHQQVHHRAAPTSRNTKQLHPPAGTRNTYQHPPTGRLHSYTHQQVHHTATPTQQARHQTTPTRQLHP